MKLLLLPLLMCLALTVNQLQQNDKWISAGYSMFKLSYTEHDKPEINDYSRLIENGIKQVQTFFNESYKKKFGIYIHPDRKSIDNQWASDWKIPGFKSECWMIASGVSERLDILSPNAWEKEACEHDYRNKTDTQQIITHELIHVFHGQSSNSVDFGDFKDLDWFVEGLATYASGQCSDKRILEIRGAVERDEIPDSLDKFWTGKMRYGLSGSVVMYIDKVYGRNMLKELLKFRSKEDLLDKLQLSEKELLAGWEEYMKNINTL